MSFALYPCEILRYIVTCVRLVAVLLLLIVKLALLSPFFFYISTYNILTYIQEQPSNQQYSNKGRVHASQPFIHIIHIHIHSLHHYNCCCYYFTTQRRRLSLYLFYYFSDPLELQWKEKKRKWKEGHLSQSYFLFTTQRPSDAFYNMPWHTHTHSQNTFSSYVLSRFSPCVMCVYAISYDRSVPPLLLNTKWNKIHSSSYCWACMAYGFVERRVGWTTSTVERKKKVYVIHKGNIFMWSPYSISIHSTTFSGNESMMVMTKSG